jgi:hypothetical protein
VNERVIEKYGRENNSSSAELNAKSLETQIISQKYEQNIAKITKR